MKSLTSYVIDDLERQRKKLSEELRNVESALRRAKKGPQGTDFVARIHGNQKIATRETGSPRKAMARAEAQYRETFPDGESDIKFLWFQTVADFGAVQVVLPEGYWKPKRTSAPSR